MMWLSMAVAIVIVLVLGWDAWVVWQARKHTFQKAENLPSCDGLLLLGTAKYTVNGDINRYYQHRIDAAWSVWKAGKVGFVVVSGDGLKSMPSETAAMRADLMDLGVPGDVIWQDPAGLRTLDSIYRYAAAQAQWSTCHHRVCVVSQPFHNQRALALARFAHIHAVAYDAEAIGWHGTTGRRIQLRERAARLRLCWDMLTHVRAQSSLMQIPLIVPQPKFVTQDAHPQ